MDLPFHLQHARPMIPDMSLNQVGKRYADKLYLESLESISKSQREELTKVRLDFAARNMTRSGSYFTAQTQVFLKQVKLLTQAWVDSRLLAYQNSGTKLNDAAFQEISSGAKQLCEQQGLNVIHNLQNQIGQTFGNQAPPNFSEAISQGVSTGVSGISASVVRRLSIMQDEAALSAAAQEASEAAAQASKSIGDKVIERPQAEPTAKHPKPHLYYWRLCEKFGEECYRTWRTELLASFLISVAIYVITKGDDPLAWRNFKIFSISTGIILAAFAMWHLVRTPWLVHRHTIGIEESAGHLWFGVFGIAIIVGGLAGAYFSAEYLLSIRATPLTLRLPPPPAPKIQLPSPPDTERSPRLLLSDRNGSINGRVFPEDEKGNIELPTLRLTNVGNLAVQQAAIRLYFSEPVTSIGGPYQPTPSDDPKLSFELYVGGSIQINPGEPWNMPQLSLRRGTASEEPISVRVKVFYGALKPEQATFRIEKIKHVTQP